MVFARQLFGAMLRWILHVHHKSAPLHSLDVFEMEQRGAFYSSLQPMFFLEQPDEPDDDGDAD